MLFDLQISQNFVEVTGEENVYYCLVEAGQITVVRKLVVKCVGEDKRKIEAAVNLWKKILQAGWGKGNPVFPSLSTDSNIKQYLKCFVSICWFLG